MAAAPPLTIVWFRQDLRLDDNPALTHAVERGAVLPVYIDTTRYQKAWLPGEAGRWWLGRSLAQLDSSLRALGARLIVLEGDATSCLLDLARSTGADAVFWNRRYEPTAAVHDARVETALHDAALTSKSFSGRLLHEPWDVRTKAGGHYKVFTPYWRAVESKLCAEPFDVPAKLHTPRAWPSSLDPARLACVNAEQATSQRLSACWDPGEDGATVLLERLDDVFTDAYLAGRDHPADDATTRLSAHLHFGEVGQHRLLARLQEHGGEGAAAMIRQLAWRDFAYQLLHHYPTTPDAPLRPEFSRVQWRTDEEGLAAWTNGQTGYPLIDAGMRQLKATGWMHNRLRMIVGSFLTKDLLIDWREGARVFWDRLVDADLANNTFGWQWVAGCGADASPYFRIFNPVTQSRKFDRNGDYIRRWLPELAALPTKHLHAPWTAPADVLRDADIVLGQTYSRPIIDHAQARLRTLKAFEVVKRSESSPSDRSGSRRR